MTFQDDDDDDDDDDDNDDLVIIMLNSKHNLSSKNINYALDNPDSQSNQSSQ